MTPVVEYVLGPADDRAFFAHHARHAPHRLAAERRVLIAGSALLAPLVLAVHWLAPLLALPVFVAATALLALWRPLSRWSFVLCSVRESAAQHGLVRLELAGDDLVLPGRDGPFAIPVAHVLRIDESATHWFVYLEPTSAIVLPRSAPGAAFVRALGAACAQDAHWRAAA